MAAMVLMCWREASSGTTPPYGAWISSWDRTILLRTSGAMAGPGTSAGGPISTSGACPLSWGFPAVASTKTWAVRKTAADVSSHEASMAKTSKGRWPFPRILTEKAPSRKNSNTSGRSVVIILGRWEFLAFTAVFILRSSLDKLARKLLISRLRKSSWVSTRVFSAERVLFLT